jgi:ABC-type oligopeptide transport system substrate-binding subunit
MAASFWSRIMKFPRTISLIATGLATLLLAACSSTPDASAAVEKTCRVYDAQNSTQLHASQASGERKAGDARALGTLQRMRGHGGAGNTLIDDLLRECS